MGIDAEQKCNCRNIGKEKLRLIRSCSLVPKENLFCPYIDLGPRFFKRKSLINLGFK